MSQTSKIVIAHLYPSEMNIYGDRGNIIALTKRLEWLGFATQLDQVSPGEEYDFTKADIVFGGGGQDNGQLVVAADLQARQENLRSAAKAGVVMLAICGTYQLFGHSFTTAEGRELAGVGIFDAVTRASQERMIGNIVVTTPFGELVGFENHSGQTELGENQAPLGTVTKGYGNNSRDNHEGALIQNAFGSYLHGPLLPKNPALSDELIGRALKRRQLKGDFAQLDNRLEHAAARVAKQRSR